MKKLDEKETLRNLILWRENNDENAATILVSSNIGLVKFIAKKHVNSGLSFEDLESAGMEGLVKAINMFDYINKPIEGFSSYIYTSIENHMLNEIKDNNKYRKNISFDGPVRDKFHNEEVMFEDVLSTDAEETFNAVIGKTTVGIVKEALECLTLRELQIITLRYGFEGERKSLVEIAKILGTNRHTISIQEKKALIKLKKLESIKKLTK